MTSGCIPFTSWRIWVQKILFSVDTKMSKVLIKLIDVKQVCFFQNSFKLWNHIFSNNLKNFGQNLFWCFSWDQIKVSPPVLEFNLKEVSSLSVILGSLTISVFKRICSTKWKKIRKTSSLVYVVYGQNFIGEKVSLQAKNISESQKFIENEAISVIE